MLIKKIISHRVPLRSQPSLRRLVAYLCLAFLLVSCAQAVETPPATTSPIEKAVETASPSSPAPEPSQTSSPTASVTITRKPPALLPTDLLNPSLTGTPPVENEMEVGPDHPAVVAAVKTLSEQLGIQADEVELVSSTHMEWSDSCLGLAGPEEMCLQMITPGYRVVLSVAGKQYAFRTDASGGVVRLEQPVGPLS